MKLSTQLTHFDAQTAVCLATIEEGEKQVSVYASAQAGEAGNYADLAQERALQLAWRFLQDGYTALQNSSRLVLSSAETNINPLPAIAQKPMEEGSIPASQSPADEVPGAKRTDDKTESSMPW